MAGAWCAAVAPWSGHVVVCPMAGEGAATMGPDAGPAGAAGVGQAAGGVAAGSVADSGVEDGGDQARLPGAA